MTDWQRRMLWTASILVGLTGIVYAWMRYLMTGGDPFSAYHHPLQPYVLDAHVLLAPLLLFAIGWFWGNHVLPKLRRRAPARRSGWALIATILTMTASGYLLQVSALSGLRAAAAWVHGISGVVYCAILVGHALFAPRVAPAASAGPGKRLAALGA